MVTGIMLGPVVVTSGIFGVVELLTLKAVDMFTLKVSYLVNTTQLLMVDKDMVG
jgi:hypothetical protein